MDDRQAMLEAISLASASMPHPNPRVGALVLGSGGEVVGRGWHRGPGEPHAEALALGEAGPRAQRGTLVVTLEPCHHHGRTPPCTGLILDAGIRRVVVGAIDPDRRVSGAGLRALRSSGVEVLSGVAGEEAEALDPGYFHHRRTGRPLVTLKMALTLDGQSAAADGTSKWITSPEARRDVHRLRSRSDAVMVGAGTVFADDPLLDARHGAEAGRQPRPVIVAGSRILPAQARVLRRDPVVFSPGEPPQPVSVVVMPGSGGVDLEAAVAGLGDSGIVDLLVEGGPTLAAGLLESGLVDRIVFYFGARLGGGSGRPAFGGAFPTLAGARALELTEVERIGPDLRVTARVGGI